MDTNDWCIIEGVQGEAEKYGKEVVRMGGGGGHGYK